MPAATIVPVCSDARAYRLASIDVLRGLVLVIMALDHVREFLMRGAELDPMADPNVGAVEQCFNFEAHLNLGRQAVFDDKCR